MSKDKKPNKSAKAALPIFALFGGQGFASSRNPLTMQSSKKLAGKSVVYIYETDKPKLPTLNSKQLQKAKSPFAAFTNHLVSRTQNADIEIQSESLTYLKNNELISSNNTTKANISGNLSGLNRKSFSHTPWTLNGGDPSTNTGSGFISCSFSSDPDNRNYGIVFSIFSANSAIFTPSFKKNGNYYYSTSYPGVSVAQIKAKHYECHSNVLPVELQKFEIE